MSRTHFQKGFTLVELAIVLMIIGLLIGGILRGQELLENARITNTVKEVKSYHGAVATFREEYGTYPGDYSIATTRIPGCNTTNKCDNGDGDGVVGTRKIGVGLLDIQTGNAKPGLETTLFWKHLALKHIITGVDPSYDPANPTMGKTHPAASIGGGWMVVHGLHVPGTPEGLWLVLTMPLTGATAYLPGGGNVLSPRQARQIDKKMDDGMADLGDVVAPDDGTCDNDDGSGSRQYLNTDYKTCALVFRL